MRQGSVISDHEHSSLRKCAPSHQPHVQLQDDSQLNTPDGSLRRSFKDLDIGGASNGQRDEENVPLASADQTGGDNQSV